MSILIKGMEMPEECCVCDFMVNGMRCSALKFCDVDDAILRGERYADCPLIELPEHGDLVDKNRMVDVLHHGSKCVSEIQESTKDEKSISYLQGVMVGYGNSIVVLNGAPVVIPAERSEDV